MWPDRPSRRLLLTAPLALAACGFRPAYAPGGPGLRLRGRVAVEAPPTPDGFRLRAELEDRLGPAGAAAATLSAEPAVEVATAAVTPAGAITRYQLAGTARWRLLSPEGRLLAEGEAHALTGYSATGPTVSSRAAAQDAEGRLMALLAQRIVERLLLLPPEALP